MSFHKMHDEFKTKSNKAWTWQLTFDQPITKLKRHIHLDKVPFCVSFVVTDEVVCCGGPVTDFGSWRPCMPLFSSYCHNRRHNPWIQMSFCLNLAPPRWLPHALASAGLLRPIGCQVCMRCSRNHPIMFLKHNVTSQYLQNANIYWKKSFSCPLSKV